MLTAACSGNSSPSAPGSPTSPSAPGASAAAGATVTGTVASGLATSSLRPAAVGLTVSVDNTSIATTVDGSGSFMLRGVPAGTVTLHFSGTGADARLTLTNVEDHATIEIHVTVSGNQATMDDDHRQTPDNRVEIEGLIAGVNISARTVRVGTNTVSVPSGTPIHHGSTPIDLSKLQVNDRVHIHATISGTTLTAQEVEVQNQQAGNPNDDNDQNDDDNPNMPGAQVELKGAVAGKGGSCPSISFTLGSTTVKTDGSTTFKDVSCASLKNGDTVEVKGARQSSTTVMATRVSKDD